MATDVPDPQTLRSWQEAFQYPIPTVRRVEQEIRRDIASNKEKLRSLVGCVSLRRILMCINPADESYLSRVRYRDLLDTAQTIVEMNERAQQVEAKMLDIGRRCNSRTVDKKSVHLHQLQFYLSESG
jgi:conserved oligomeric Golgi complex subunit 1